MHQRYVGLAVSIAIAIAIMTPGCSNTETVRPDETEGDTRSNTKALTPPAAIGRVESQSNLAPAQLTPGRETTQRPAIDSGQTMAQYPAPDRTRGGGVPTAIRVPALGIDASVVPVGLDSDGAMGAPTDPWAVGWYSPGAGPGDSGNLLLDGHVDWTDQNTGAPFGAVFWRLRELAHGDVIYIFAGDRSFKYVVETTVTLEWDDPSGADYLQPTETPTATIITCGGIFDRAARNYSHRIIVVARLAA